MDYNFNFKSTPQKKFKMSSFMQPPRFGRCYSTSSSINVAPCLANNMAVNPLLNFISGFQNQNTAHRRHAMPKTTTPFNSTSMAVSCFVSGLVSNGKSSQNSQDCCDELILDVLFNKFAPFENSGSSGTTSLNNMKTEYPAKRTYAEVTKEKPKPRVQINCIKSTANCDNNFTVLHHSQSIIMESSKPGCLQETMMMGISKVSSGTLFSSASPRQKSCSSSSDSSSEHETNKKNRTISECSVDSDDSYIVFQPEDDGITVCDSSSEEEDSTDEADEEGTTCELNAPLPLPETEGTKFRTKKVCFKPDDELVKVHPLVVWDFASRAARVGPWEQYARDRDRFKKRIQDISNILNPVLQPSHRQTVFINRFMAT